MLKKRNLLLFAFIFSASMLFSQTENTRKIIKTNRVANAPKVDGILDDTAWENAEIANNFVMVKPNNGGKEIETHKTEVKIVYNDEAIFVSAMLFDNDPDNIPMEFTSRDNIAQTDFFMITLNPNNDGLNMTEFIVMSTGTQADSNVSNGEEDFNWSAVWKSAVKITDNGWTVEMKIPYSELRFSNQKIQTWGINFYRKLVKQNAEYSWNRIDNTKGIWTQYDGVLSGIENINPPVRLSFYPYASTSVSYVDKKNRYNNNLGLDLKYGITENFTLDLTLVPDFGQTAFDDVELNLGPFEQEFSEQRQFFTEGTELFGKGNLFYSRRIGNRPTAFYIVDDNLADNETVTKNPEKVNLLNAVKISGRTKGGLGIGFFNAVTNKAEATIKKTVKENGKTTDTFYKKITEPVANYNVLVLDQQFNKNSSVTFINTNVLREGEFRDANITGLLYYLTNKNNTHFIDGNLKMANINENGSMETGYSFDLSIGKSAGNWQGEIGYNLEDEKYKINDLGFQRRNNEQALYGNISYKILNPTKYFNDFKVSVRFFSSFLYKPKKHTDNSYRLSVFTTTKKRFTFGGNIFGNIGKLHDYYEARKSIAEERFFIRNPRISVNAFTSTDFRKKLAIDFKAFVSRYFNENKQAFGIITSPRYRFSNRFSLIYNFKYITSKNVLGYVDNEGDDIIFGKRKSKSYENEITGKYSFGIKSSLSISFRHLWTPVEYSSQYYVLNSDGYLSNHNYTDNNDRNFNNWNLDLSYLWEFAPGSQLIVFYRNFITSDNQSKLNFVNNLEELFNQPTSHTLSLKLVYFIDYNNIKNAFSKKYL